MNRFLLFLLVVGPFNATATLLPGFDKNEYLEVLRLAAHSVDTPWTTYKVPLPEQHQLVFRSKVVGLDNRADIWLRNDGAVHVHLRGTTAREISWMENFMLPKFQHKALLSWPTTTTSVTTLATPASSSACRLDHWYRLFAP